MENIHELEMPSITGEMLSFSKYKDQACLIVNVATR